MQNAKKVQSWFKTHIKDHGIPYTLDKNQAKIVLDQHKNTLVTARAGSGKTRTVVAKITYLLAYQKVAPEHIIVFAFNKKACEEINQRLTKISFDDVPLFEKAPNIATTFHAFAYQILGGKAKLGDKIPTEKEIDKIFHSLKLLPDKIPTVQQFITRSEQQFFQDYSKLYNKINQIASEERKAELSDLAKYLEQYKTALHAAGFINFNELISEAAKKLHSATPYKYIFVDEYQDFSLLFLTLIKALRQTCPSAHLLAVGDDWQAINRFAGSDVKFFQHFEKYFPEDCKKLFIPTNYRSGAKIVKNANFFMAKALNDYQGCKSGNKLKSKIYLKDINQVDIPANNPDIPELLQKYFQVTKTIIQQNPGKFIKILSRNNNLSFKDWSLEKFVTRVAEDLATQGLCGKQPELTFSTIHRSKGLEADVVILLEIDSDKFPGKDKSGGIFDIFGDNAKTLFQDEVRLFYVALTRPKEKLYILSKTTKIRPEDKVGNFFSYLNENYLNPFF